VRGLEVAAFIVSLLLVALAPGEDLSQLHDVQYHFQNEEAMTGLESLLHVWFDEFHLQVNNQYVEGARGGIRRIAVVTKRDSFDSKSVRVSL
jgi:hypothetical protein